MRKSILYILLLFGLSAQASPIEPLMEMLQNLYGSPQIVEHTDDYMRIHMADSCTYEAYTTTDSIVLIQTVCAPICSSCVRVYNKEWDFLHALEPTCSGIFPLAEYKDGQLIWHDNTDQLLDQEEKKLR